MEVLSVVLIYIFAEAKGNLWKRSPPQVRHRLCETDGGEVLPAMGLVWSSSKLFLQLLSGYRHDSR